MRSTAILSIFLPAVTLALATFTIFAGRWSIKGRLRELDIIRALGFISEAEYRARRTELLLEQ